MTWYAHELEPLLAVAAASVTSAGTLVEANAGFLHLIDLQEAERRQISLELHEEIAQVLAATNMNLQAMKRTGTKAAAGAPMTEGMTTIRDAINQIHGMAVRLRPPILDALGILPALEFLVERESSPGKLRVTLESVPEDISLPNYVAEVCYRVAQEALTNVVRHANASKAIVRIERCGDCVSLSVRDNGRGFDAAGAPATRAFGLLGMKERTKLVGGTLQIHSRPGTGTEVRVAIGLMA